jgi:ParB family chromosome partitioning protein
MARKNLLQVGQRSADFPETRLAGGAEAPTPDVEARRPLSLRRGPGAQAANDFMKNSQREIDPDVIDDDSPRDRLTVEDDSIAELREQIRAQGQIVPIMVRLNHERPGRYLIVYGRRRLAAIRGITDDEGEQIPIRALIRNLDNTQAVIAQGQENNARRDPSFIEKALFAAQLRAIGYDTPVILDALVTDKTILSRMKSVTDVIPVDLIRVIGATPGVGRNRWIELSRLLEKHKPIDPIAACFPEGSAPTFTSEQRLEAAIGALSKVDYRQPPRNPPESREVRFADGQILATLKGSATKFDVSFSKKAHPDFVAWLAEKGDEVLTRLHGDWVKERGSD